MPIFLGGALLHIVCLVILWTWTPNPDQSYVFFLIAALWGAADAVWQTQINGEYILKCVYHKQLNGQYNDLILRAINIHSNRMLIFISQEVVI